MAKYKIKEIHYTIQGEGYHAGRAAIFCRFSGCNLWSGREEDRHKAICRFCDTDFWGTDGHLGGAYNLSDLVDQIASLWPSASQDHRFIVFTGGEPALQLDEDLIDLLHHSGFQIAIETNGTLDLPRGIDWICMSPKANTDIVVTQGQELKIVYPQQGIDPEDFKDMYFEHFFLQPMDNERQDQNLAVVLHYCKSHPKWKVSLQTHKLMGIP